MSAARSRAARVLALWCPDWPAVAAAAVDEVPPTRPVVVLHANRVVAGTATARAEGVRRGLTRREAQARCPGLYVAQADPDRDARLFEPVVAAVAEVVPGVEVLRPGLLVLAARGAARFFGSEEAAAERLVDAVAATGVECAIGIADELSTAVIAARRATIVPPGEGARFLAPLPVAELAVEPSLTAPERADLVDLLHRLGLRRIGDFATLSPAEVGSRFGADAIRAHRCARAESERPPSAAPPAVDLAVEYPCDPPIDRIDAAAFAGRLLATRLHERLAGASVACTRLIVSAETAAGEQLSRVWRCAEPLTPEGTADRVRWQLDGWLTQRALRGVPPDEEPDGAVHGRGVAPGDPGADPFAPSAAGTPHRGGARAAGAAEGKSRGGAEPVGAAWDKGRGGAGPAEAAGDKGREGAKPAGVAEGKGRGGAGPVGAAEDKSRSGVRPVGAAGGRGGAGPVGAVGGKGRGGARSTGTPPHRGGPPAAPITVLRLEPIEVVTTAALQMGLWGEAGDNEERARRALVRVQGLLGGTAVQVGVLSGGRGPAERITLIALGDEPAPRTDPDLPWPGRLPEPAPAVVLVDHPGVRLEAADSSPVWVTDRGDFTAVPARLYWGRKHWSVTGWAGPWLLDEQWWGSTRPDCLVRAQVLLDDRVRTLLLLGYDGTWHVEGLYE
ncbi:DNA polymerase Y family protein [Nocardia sp. BMG111209]|uniref:DNA polymerase Y family protein n=1 Tax=Nocardia sp. BMG111209 TaxID=1160137 RepID=UPI001E29A90D|nr:DNA polymerase Y family protein [Nocardia sp. BMG111209]